MERVCKACGRTKPLGEFPPYSAKGWKGRRHTCRVCWKAKWAPIIAVHEDRYQQENVNGARDKKIARAAARYYAPGGRDRRDGSRVGVSDLESCGIGVVGIGRGVMRDAIRSIGDWPKEEA